MTNLAQNPSMRTGSVGSTPLSMAADDLSARALPVALPLLIIVLFSHLSNTLIKLYGIPSVLQALIAIVALLIWRSRDELRPARAVLHPITLLLAAYAVVVFTSSIGALESAPADARLVETLKALAICVLVASAAAHRRLLGAVAAAIVATAAVLGSVSLLQITTGLLDPALGGLVELETGTIYGGHAAPRAAGPPVSDPNFYGRLLLVALPFGIALTLQKRPHGRRLASGAATLIIAGAVLATYSRGAMLALAAIGVLTLLSVGLTRKRVSILLVMAFAGVILLPADVQKRLLTVESVVAASTGSAERDSSVEKRKLLLRSGLAMFRDHPLTGVGAGHFGVLYPTYANQVGSEFIDYHDPGTIEYPHGLYLEVASETGVLGLLTFCGAVAAGFVSAWRSRRRLLVQERHDEALLATAIAVALAGYLLTSLFLHETHLRYVGLQLGLVIAVHRLSWHVASRDGNEAGR